LVLMAGMALWLAYGVLLGDLPIIFWNGVGVSLNAILIALKIRSDQKKKGAEPQIIR